MARTVTILILLILAGCGGTAAQQPQLTPSAAHVHIGGRDRLPVASPPRTPGPSAPPPAWVHVIDGSRWLAFASYCWSTNQGHGACVDMVGPEQRRDIPKLAVKPGELLRFHLAFTAKSVDLYLGQSGYSSVHRSHTSTLEWRAASRRGRLLVMLDVRASGGQASYLVWIQVR
ncbi:MAG: hypothetical protein ACYDHH_02485 [Solirubrobacteraceae bacterium]